MYNALPYPPSDYHVCPCCGTEFGTDDEDLSHQQLREMWLGSGARWFFGTPPAAWNWFNQLYEAGLMPLRVTGREAEVQSESGSPRPISRFEYSVRPIAV